MDPTVLEPMAIDQIEQALMAVNTMVVDPIKADSTGADQTEADQTEADQIEVDQTAMDSTAVESTAMDQTTVDPIAEAAKVNIVQSDRIMLRILHYLDIETRLRMRCLSKRLKQLVDANFEITDLVVNDEFFFYNRWKFSNELVVYKRSIIPTLNLPSHSPLLNSLRRLKVKYFRHDDLIRLEMFQASLIQLEIETIELIKDDLPVNLFYLQFLSITNVVHPKRAPLTFNTPKVQSLKFGEDTIEYIRFQGTNRVHSLEIGRGRTDTSRYPNLRHLTVYQLLLNETDSLLQFACLPNLVSLNCNIFEDAMAHLSVLTPDQLQSLRTTFEFLTQVKAQVKQNLEIRIQDVLLVPGKAFHEYHFDRTLLGVHEANADSLSNRITSVAGIDYLSLRAVTSIRPLELFEKYVNIQAVFIANTFNSTQQVQPGEFIEFLASCKGIRSLFLNFPRFTQQFYREMILLPSLSTLNFLRCFESVMIDLDFVLDFEYLRCLWTNVLGRSALLELMPKLKFPGKYEFVFSAPEASHENTLRLEKKAENQYKVEILRRENNSTEPGAFAPLVSFENMSFGQVQSEILDEPRYGTLFKHFLDHDG